MRRRWPQGVHPCVRATLVLAQVASRTPRSGAREALDFSGSRSSWRSNQVRRRREDAVREIGLQRIEERAVGSELKINSTRWPRAASSRSTDS